MSKKNKLSKIIMIFGKNPTFWMNFYRFFTTKYQIFDKNHKIYGKLQFISNLETNFHKKSIKIYRTEIV